jgi:hypothetical protein
VQNLVRLFVIGLQDGGQFVGQRLVNFWLGYVFGIAFDLPGEVFGFFYK